LALTGSAGRPQAFPLLKVDRQCCAVAAFLRLTRSDIIFWKNRTIAEYS
jgi:hypothetical protein